MECENVPEPVESTRDAAAAPRGPHNNGRELRRLISLRWL